MLSTTMALTTHPDALVPIGGITALAQALHQGGAQQTREAWGVSGPQSDKEMLASW